MAKEADNELVRLRLTGRLLLLARAASADGDLAEGVRYLMAAGAEADRVRHESRDLANTMVDALDTLANSVVDIRNMVERMDADRQAWQRALTDTLRPLASSRTKTGGEG